MSADSTLFREKFTTGISGLNGVLGGFYLGSFVVLTGERGEGKSTFASQIGTFAIEAGYKTFFYSGELMNWQFREWFDRQMVGDEYINRIVLPEGGDEYSVDASIQDKLEQYYDGKVYLYNNDLGTEKSEGETVLKIVERAVTEYGCKVLFVDNLMTAMVDDANVDLNRQQTRFINSLVKITRRHHVMILLVAHPRKMGSNSAFTNDDIAGSGNIANLADVVLKYSKPKGKGVEPNTMKRLVYVYKNRKDGKLKEDGIELFFNEKSKRISETETFDWELSWNHEEEASDGSDQ